MPPIIRSGGIKSDNTKPLITQRLCSDLGRSVGEMTITNWYGYTSLRDPNLPTHRKSCVIKRTQKDLLTRIWAWSWCPANLLHHKMTKKMHFESHIFQVKCDLIDTSLVTLCHAIGKKIVPMLNMRKNEIFPVTCHDVTVHQNTFAIVFILSRYYILFN